MSNAGNPSLLVLKPIDQLEVMIRQSIYRAVNKRFLRRPLVRSQGGYLMVSMMIALAVTGALTALYVERQAEQVRLERGEQLGYALSVLGAGFNVYLDENYATLAADLPRVPEISNALQPTANELIRKVNIRGVAPVPPIITGGSYKFQVSYPPDCNAEQKRSEARCRPVGLAYVDKPLKRGSSADYVALARAVRVMKGRGGYARPENPSQFTFPDSIAVPATIAIANPIGVPGILAWRAGTLPDDEERLKTNGSNRMNNTLRLDGENIPHDVKGVRDFTGSGTVTSQNLDILGKAQVLGSGLWSTALTVNGEAIVKENLTVLKKTATDTLHFSRFYNPNTPCAEKGLVSVSPSGEILYCNGKEWQLTTQHSADAVAVARTNSRDRPVIMPLGNWVYCRLSAGHAVMAKEINLSHNQGAATWYIVVPKRMTITVWCSGKMPRV